MDDALTRREWIGLTSKSAIGAIVATNAATIANAQAQKAIGVRVVDKEGYDKVITANKGKVVVVDCWATWCVPCRKAFPKTVELSKAYSAKDVVVVSLCFDEVKKGQAPEAVKRFLAVHEADFENLISSLDISGDGAEAFGIPDGALPHFKIYGKDGKVFKTFEGGDDKKFTHEDIEAAVKKALKAEAK